MCINESLLITEGWVCAGGEGAGGGLSSLTLYEHLLLTKDDEGCGHEWWEKRPLTRDKIYLPANLDSKKTVPFKGRFLPKKKRVWC